MRTDEAFVVLGLSPDTPLRDVRRRYHALIKELHPDTSGEDTDQAARVIEAYHRIREGTQREQRHREGPGRTRSEPRPVTPKDIFTLGRWLTTASDRTVRLYAVRRLAASGLQSASVFLRQAMLDGDREIASSAMEGFLRCAGLSAERSILNVYDRMTGVQRLILIAAIEQTGRLLPRVLSWALADRDPRVRRAARRLVRNDERSA